MILVLAGTAEARALAEGLAAAGVPTLASLAGVTAAPAAYAVPVRTGGFGGAAGLRAFLCSEGVRAVVDATHPFAARISASTAEACGDAGVPLLRLERAPWDVEDVAGPEEAMALIPEGAVVLLALGGRVLAPWAGLRGRVVVRAVEPVEPPFPAEVVLARPPFDEASERALMTRLGVTHLVARNAGGTGRAKLDAARVLGVRVILLRRPPPPPGVEAVATVAEALAWARGRA